MLAKEINKSQLHPKGINNIKGSKIVIFLFHLLRFGFMLIF